METCNDDTSWLEGNPNAIANQQVAVSGSSGAVYLYYNAPAGVSFKFLMGPA